MRKKNREKCTQETQGTVINIKHRGTDSPVIVSVEYEVNDVHYQISESKKYRIEAIKIGFLPIGQKSTPKLGMVEVGSSVRVSYNPSCPEMAYLTDNVGRINSV